MRLFWYWVCFVVFCVVCIVGISSLIKMLMIVIIISNLMSVKLWLCEVCGRRCFFFNLLLFIVCFFDCCEFVLIFIKDF